MRFRVKGLGFGVLGFGFAVQECRVCDADEASRPPLNSLSQGEPTVETGGVAEGSGLGEAGAPRTGEPADCFDALERQQHAPPPARPRHQVTKMRVKKTIPVAVRTPGGDGTRGGVHYGQTVRGGGGGGGGGGDAETTDKDDEGGGQCNLPNDLCMSGTSDERGEDDYNAVRDAAGDDAQRAKSTTCDVSSATPHDGGDNGDDGNGVEEGGNKPLNSTP